MDVVCEGALLRWMNHYHLISVSAFLSYKPDPVTTCCNHSDCVKLLYIISMSIRCEKTHIDLLKSLPRCRASDCSNMFTVLITITINSFSNTTTLPESNLHICSVGDIKAFCAPFFYHLSPPVSLLLTAMRTISWWDNGCLTPVLTAIHVVSCLTKKQKASVFVVATVVCVCVYIWRCL